MPETLCSNIHCPLAPECYRARAKPEKYDWCYSDFKYENGKCKDFMSMPEGRKYAEERAD